PHRAVPDSSRPVPRSGPTQCCLWRLLLIAYRDWPPPAAFRQVARCRLIRPEPQALFRELLARFESPDRIGPDCDTRRPRHAELPDHAVHDSWRGLNIAWILRADQGANKRARAIGRNGRTVVRYRPCAAAREPAWGRS